MENNINYKRVSNRKGILKCDSKLKLYYLILFVLTLIILISGCKAKQKDVLKSQKLLIAAAASLQNVMEELEPIYQSHIANTTLTFTYGSSGALMQQIEQGAPIDVFLSASKKQMDQLEEGDFIHSDSRVNFVENKVVLIVPSNSKLEIYLFSDILKASKIALGDPSFVPAGQYAEEVFRFLGLWEEVAKVAVFGNDVTEVLNWVGTGNVDAGVVYVTDAITNKEVVVVDEAMDRSCSKIVYPAAVVKESKYKDAAEEFVSFLKSKEAKEIFEKHGFYPME